MFGLMVFGAAALYLGLMFFVVRLAWRRGRSNGGSVGKASVFAFLGFLLVYLPVFWNHIPVLLAHRSMCAKDAGFKAYVTPEQWIAQNKDAIDKLTKEEVEKQERESQSVAAPDGFRRALSFGGLLITERRGTKRHVLNIAISKDEQVDRDAQTNQILATYVDYSASGHPGDIRGWIFPSSCFVAADLGNPRQSYFNFISNLRGTK